MSIALKNVKPLVGVVREKFSCILLNDIDLIVLQF